MLKRVVHCIDKLQGGGAQTQLIHLCNYTDKEKFEVIILCFDLKAVIDINSNIKLITVKKRKGFGIVISWYDILKKIFFLKPDILQLWVPELITLPAVVSGVMLRNCLIISCSRRIPITKFGVLWFKDRAKYIAHVLSDIFTVNYPMPLKRKSVLNIIFERKKSVIIFNGLEVDVLSKYNKHEVFKEGVFKLIYAGRLTYQKNVNLLILALRQLKAEGYTIILEIFGQGEDENILRQLTAESGLKDSVNFNGFKSNWHQLSRGGHAFVLPSNLEGMPNVLFEAIAIGMPILASNIDEISCHFKNEYDAILFEPNSVEAITIAVKQAMFNPKKLSGIYNQSYKTIQRYSVSSMVTQYQNLYDQAISKKEYTNDPSIEI